MCLHYDSFVFHFNFECALNASAQRCERATLLLHTTCSHGNIEHVFEVDPGDEGAAMASPKRSLPGKPVTKNSRISAEALVVGSAWRARPNPCG